MAKVSTFGNITKWLKLFTYISGTVLLLTNNDFDKLKYLIPLALLVFFINYSREYWLEAGRKPVQFVWASMAAEILLIIVIGFFEKDNISILFYFVCLSSTIIIHPFTYSIPIAAGYLASGLLIYALRNGFVDFMKSAVPMLFNYGVSTVFVMGMSYLVKMQMREKERLAHINKELEQAYRKVIESSATSQKLTIEQERTRMAREIHDTLAHTLTNLIVQLEACKRLATLNPSRLPGELDKAQELSRSGFNDVKRSIKALRPQVMEDKSLIASIHSVIQETMENTKVNINFDNSLPNEIKLPSQIEIAIFRVIQESITNSIRHGHASEIGITLKQESNKLRLFISDNGLGCLNIKKGFGIQGIKERIESLDGSAEFTSAPGRGFKTNVLFPRQV